MKKLMEMKESYFIKYSHPPSLVQGECMNIGLKGANNRFRSAASFRSVYISLQDTHR